MKLQQISIAGIVLLTLCLPALADYEYKPTKEAAEKWQLGEAQTTLQTTLQIVKDDYTCSIAALVGYSGDR